MRGGLLVALVVAGCARVVPYSRARLACQDQAVDLVWRGCYGRTDAAPDIWWVPAAAQNCGRTGARGFMTDAGCAGGDAWRDGMDLIDYHRGWQGTSLAHESAHVIQARQGLPADMAHASAPFQPGGAVEQCNARLAAAQLCGP